MTRPEPTQTSIFTASSCAAAAVLTFIFALAIAMSLPAQAQTLTVLHTFTGGDDGATPYAGLTMDQAGNLYGTTSAGGAGYGTVFKLSHAGAGWVLSTLHTFQGGADGAYPYARVVFGPDGALYGTTSDYEYNGGYGTVYSLRPPATACPSIRCPWIETVLYRFTGGDDGGFPGYGDLAFDAAGNIYGTTMYGGTSCDCGVVFELSRSGASWTESVLYSFTGDGGSIPYAGVVLDSAGNLYGTTAFGGADNGGVVFQLNRSGSSWTETVLHSFDFGSDGANPIGGLIMDQQGSLYGTTPAYGSEGSGTVYELQPAGHGWSFSVLATLSGYVGPEDAPTMDAAGNLYATSYGDGIGSAGNVFELTPSGGSWTYSDLYDFNGQDGAFPIGSVVLDAQGDVYGTTSAYGGGEVWELRP